MVELLILRNEGLKLIEVFFRIFVSRSKTLLAVSKLRSDFVSVS